MSAEKCVREIGFTLPFVFCAAGILIITVAIILMITIAEKSDADDSKSNVSKYYSQSVSVDMQSAQTYPENFEDVDDSLMSGTDKESEDENISGMSYLGITGTEVTDVMSQYYALPLGIFVVEIEKNGPSYNKGIEVNDIITAIDGKKTETLSQVYAILEKCKVGEKVVLSVYKLEDKQYVNIVVTLGSLAE